MAEVLTSAKDLREKRAPLALEIKRQADVANDANRDFTAEERASWEKVNKDYDDLTKQIEIRERAERVEREQSVAVNVNMVGRGDVNVGGKKSAPDDGRPLVTAEHRALAFQAWFRHQAGMPLKKRHAEAVKLTKFPHRSAELRFSLARDYAEVRDYKRISEKRALSAFTNTAGGYTVPEGFVSKLETNLLAFCNVRAVADVLRTSSGQDLPWPTADDTTAKGNIIGEAVAVGTTTQPTFAQMILRAWRYTSNFVLIPHEIMDDSAFNLTDWLGDLLGMRIGRRQADDFTTGTGAGQPTGIVTAATSGLTAASATAIAADELYTLKHKIDPAYRAGCSWMFHDNILLYIKKLKDGVGSYLWQSSLVGGVPDTIDGDPLFINQSMDSSVATTKKTVLYGLMSKYKIRDVNDVRMVKLVERYADQDLVGVGCFMRSDANLLDAGAHPVKYLVQA